METHDFGTQGMITDPGQRASLYNGLPRDPQALRPIVQGLLIHVFWAGRYGLTLTPEREAEVQLRLVERQLERIVALDDAPLTVSRPLDKRLVGNCRDFSVITTSILRHFGVPARARCGFAGYFEPGKWVDHWVVEYWDGPATRWRLMDVQLDPFQVGILKPDFDPGDVPRDQFLDGGTAWQMCRAGTADPSVFGIADMWGQWFVQADLVRDIAALNKVELLPWDVWGVMRGPGETPASDELRALDELAALSAGDAPGIAEIRRRFASDARFRVPASITSYTAGGPRSVALPFA